MRGDVGGDEATYVWKPEIADRQWQVTQTQLKPIQLVQYTQLILSSSIGSMDDDSLADLHYCRIASQCHKRDIIVLEHVRC